MTQVKFQPVCKMRDDSARTPRRKYYTHRKGHYPYLYFPQIKEIFQKDILSYITRHSYLLEAEGFRTHGFEQTGTWGRNIPIFIMKHLQMEDIWPFEEKLPGYNMTTFFTVIEFLFDYVSKPIGGGKYDKKPAQADFRARVNDLLNLYCDEYADEDDNEIQIFYELSKEGEIRERVHDGLKELIEDIPQSRDSDNVDDKIEYAISQYLKYGATLEEKKDAIRTLGDVLEYLKKSEIKMPKKDDSALFNILNSFSIRHHERSQQSEYSTKEWYEFFFHLLLASINVLLKLNEVQSE